VRGEVLAEDVATADHPNRRSVAMQFEKIEVMHELGYVYRDIKP
jgi:hypothetical protein